MIGPLCYKVDGLIKGFVIFCGLGPHGERWGLSEYCHAKGNIEGLLKS